MELQQQISGDGLVVDSMGTEPSVAFVSPSVLAETVTDAVRVSKGEDLLAPVHLLVRSWSLGQSLLRHMARHGGLVNVRTVTPSRLATQLLSAATATTVFRRLTSERARELTRLVALGARPPLSAGASPVLVHALQQVFRDLRERSDLEVEAIAEESPLSTELVRMFHEFRERAHGFLDDRDLLEAASMTIDETCTPVVAVMSEPGVLHEAQLLERLASVRRLQTIAVLSGDDILDGALSTSFWGLGQTISKGAASSNPENPAGVPIAERNRLVVAPDPDLEVQLAVEAVLEHARAGGSLGQSAVLFAQGTAYASLLQTQFEEAGVPWRGKSAALLSQSVIGRFVTSTLELLEDDSAIARWFECAPLREQPDSNELLPSVAWAARCRLGRSSDLASLIVALSADSAELVGDETENQGLVTFLRELSSWLTELPSTWAGWASWLQRGIHRYVGPAVDRSDWPRVEAKAALQFEERLLALGLLTESFDENQISHSTFAATVADELQARQSRRAGSEGVLVAEIDEAVGIDFDLVVVCGLAEGVLPGSSRKTGLLASLHAPGEERAIDRQRRAFLQVLSGKHSQVILTMPKADRRKQRACRPSPWLLEHASRLAGSPLSSQEFMGDRSSFPWLEIVPSFKARLERTAIPSTPQLARLMDLQHRHGSETSPASGDVATADEELGFEVVRTREAATMTRFDGFIGAHPSLSVDNLGAMSPTSLEHWAVCPFRFFLRTILGVAVDEKDDDPFALAANERGNLVHEILEQFIRTARPRTHASEPWSEDERSSLHALADRLAERVHQLGKAPEGLLWEVERRSMHDHLDALLDRDEALRSQRGVLPGAVEVSFGGSSSRPVELGKTQRGTPVRFRGRIDRIDRSLDGQRVIAYDYKTGRSDRTPDLAADPVAKGTKLQLAAYAAAVAETAPPGADVRAEYWFVNDAAAQYPLKGIPFDDKVKQRAEQAIETMVHGIESGLFPMVPGDEDHRRYVNCRSCSYDDICPVDRGEQWARKQTDDRATTFHRLTEVDDQ